MRFVAWLIPLLSLILVKSTSKMENLNNLNRLKSVGISNRIAELEGMSSGSRSPAELAELDGILAKCDSYSNVQFSKDHLEFKEEHNKILLKLHQWCGQGNVFVLDGADAGSSKYLRSAGVDKSAIFVANRYEDTFDKILGLDLLPASNVFHAKAEDYLRNSDINFSCLYLDACGGNSASIIDMIEGALGERLGKSALDRDLTPSRTSDRTNRIDSMNRMCIGFSILGGGSDARNVVDKEMEVVQACVRLAAKRGMRLSHVSDDPQKFGIEIMRKVHWGTLTTWVALDRIDRPE